MIKTEFNDNSEKSLDPPSTSAPFLDTSLNDYNNLLAFDASVLELQNNELPNVSSLSVLNIDSSSKRKILNKIFSMPHDSQTIKDKDKIGRKIFGYLYFKDENLMEREEKRLFLVDQGADVNLASYAHLKNIFSQAFLDKNLKRSDFAKISCFNKSTMHVRGKIFISCGFEQFHQGPVTQVEFLVLDDPNMFCPFLLGEQFLRKHQSIISYPEVNGRILPRVQLTAPFRHLVTVGYLKRQDLFIKTLDIELYAKESIQMNCELPFFNMFLPSDKILVSLNDNSVPNLMVIPTTNLAQNGLYVCITNLGSNDFKGSIKLKLEKLDDDFEIVNENNGKKLNGPFIQEVVILDDDKLSDPILEINDIQFLNSQVDSNFIHGEKIHSKDDNSFDSNTDESSFQSEAPSFNNDNNKGFTKNDDESEIKDEDYIQDTPLKRRLNEIDINKVSDIDDGELDPNKNIFHKKDYGLSIPEKRLLEEIVITDILPPIIKPYIENLFIKKFPKLISTDSYDVGDVSKYLGCYKIRLKPGCSLPSHQKLYFCTGELRTQLSTILDFLVKRKIIAPEPHQSSESQTNMSWASPCYLISKKSPESPYRLIIDYSYINSLLQTPPAVLDRVDCMINSLRNVSYYTTLDISSAFYSVSIDRESQPLTRFLSPMGAFYFLRTPQGLASAPGAYSNFAEKVIHHVPVYDSQGNLLFHEDGTIQTRRDPIENCFYYLDDIIIGTASTGNYQRDIDLHFQHVEKLLYRLNFHSTKLSYSKCSFATTQIKWLGWQISNGRLFPDPSRVSKLINFPVPTCTKHMRSFLGLFQTLRSMVPLEFSRLASILTPLTSGTKVFKMNDEQLKAFNDLKYKLTVRPLFSNIVEPSARKLLWTDGSLSKGSAYGGILTQIVSRVPQDNYIPDHLNLNITSHQIIYSEKLKFKPVSFLLLDNKAKTIDDLANNKVKQANMHWNELPLLGFTNDNFNDSLFICLQTIAYLYKINIVPITEFKKRIVDSLKGIYAIQISSAHFNNDHIKYKQYINDFLCKPNQPLDPDLVMIKTISPIMRKKLVIINTTELLQGKNIIEYGTQYSGCVFVLSLQKIDNKLIFSPFYQDKKDTADLKEYKNKLQLIGYFSQKCSEAEAKLSVYERELAALLKSLSHFTTLIGNSRITVLTDSHSLYLCFHKQLRAQSMKLTRWVLKLLFQWPHLELQFIPGKQNISDILTKYYVAPTAIKFNLKRCEVSKDIDKYLDYSRTYNLKQFEEFVEDHNDLIHIDEDKEEEVSIHNINGILDNVEAALRPLKILKTRLSYTNMQNEQEAQYKDLIDRCTTAVDFQITDDDKKLSYKLINGLLYIKQPEDNYRLLVPDRLVSMLIFLSHLSAGHAGLIKMKAVLKQYYFQNFTTTIVNHLKICFPCFLNNFPRRAYKLGTGLISDYPMQTMALDFAESVGLSPGQPYNHILVCVCTFTSYTFAFPTKTKTSSEVITILSNCLIPHYQIKNILCDNAAVFGSKTFYRFLNIFNIKRIIISAFRPQANTYAEKKIGLLKGILKKYNVNLTQYSWAEFLGLAVRALNLAIHPVYHLSPLQMVHGNSPHSENQWAEEFIGNQPINHNPHISLEEDAKIRKDLIKKVQQYVAINRIERMDKENKNRMETDFEVNNVVFAKNRTRIEGTTQPLKSFYHEEPLIVRNVYKTSLLLYRPSTSHLHLYYKGDVKKFNKLDTSIILPSQIREILIRLPSTWSIVDYETLTNYSKYEFPEAAIPLRTTAEVIDFDETLPQDFEENILKDHQNKEPLHPYVQDEIFFENDLEENSLDKNLSVTKETPIEAESNQKAIDKTKDKQKSATYIKPRQSPRLKAKKNQDLEEDEEINDDSLGTKNVTFQEHPVPQSQ